MKPRYKLNWNVTDIDDIEFGTHPLPGAVHAVVTYPNGYGASIVGGGEFGLYGNGETTFELATVKVLGDEWEVTYETPITKDVLGWVPREDVNAILNSIKELPND